VHANHVENAFLLLKLGIALVAARSAAEKLKSTLNWELLGSKNMKKHVRFTVVASFSWLAWIR
jgi:hypothetical protein